MPLWWCPARAQGRSVAIGAEDCGGNLVMPGLIELHTDNLEHHIEPRRRVGWPHAATAALVPGDLWGDVARGVATVTAAPAEAVGLSDRGRVGVGARADLIRGQGRRCASGAWRLCRGGRVA
jgi:alpha-D-ribose 1-methylphosphonate 5-triphosphate diphosphatase